MKDAKELRNENFRTVFEMFKEQTLRDDPSALQQGMLRKFALFLGTNEAFMSHFCWVHHTLPVKTCCIFIPLW